MTEAAVSDTHEGNSVSPECYHAYISAEIKIPNTLIAVGPYVGHAAMRSIPAGANIKAAVKQFGTAYKFSRHQIESAIKSVTSVHHRFGVLVLPEGADLGDKIGMRIFKQERFEVVYMEGVLNILESILVLHGVKGGSGIPRDSQVAELLEQPNKLSTTIAVFAAAERAINSAAATEKSDRFRNKFNFILTGEKSRPMNPAEKIAIQTETMPFIIAAVRPVLEERQLVMPQQEVENFVQILTSPELYQKVP